jgi:hypothetical protein
MTPEDLLPVDDEGLEDIASALEEKRDAETGGTEKELVAISNPKDWIVLPGKIRSNYSYPDMYVSLSLEDTEDNWMSTHNYLDGMGMSMLTPRQFFDFIDLLKMATTRKKLRHYIPGWGEPEIPLVYDMLGKPVEKSRLRKALSSIVNPDESEGAEWLDAHFVNGSGAQKGMYMRHSHRGVGIKKHTEEKLLPSSALSCETMDIRSINSQGLPSKMLSCWSPWWHGLEYVGPQNDGYASFDAIIYHPKLNCHTDWDNRLRVRMAMVKQK